MVKTVLISVDIKSNDINIAINSLYEHASIKYLSFCFQILSSSFDLFAHTRSHLTRSRTYLHVLVADSRYLPRNLVIKILYKKKERKEKGKRKKTASI